MLSAEAEWLKAEGTQGALKGHDVTSETLRQAMRDPLQHCTGRFHNVSASVVAYRSFVFFSALSLQFLLTFAANRLQRLG